MEVGLPLHPGAAQKEPGGECSWTAPEEGTNWCAPGCELNGVCDGKGFCKCNAGSWGIDCGITMGKDGFPALHKRGLGAAGTRPFTPRVKPSTGPFQPLITLAHPAVSANRTRHNRVLFFNISVTPAQFKANETNERTNERTNEPQDDPA